MVSLIKQVSNNHYIDYWFIISYFRTNNHMKKKKRKNNLTVFFPFILTLFRMVEIIYELCNA